MKRLVFICLFLSLSAASFAQDQPSKPFKEMTLAELQLVDTNGLNEKAKRDYKKYLKRKTKGLRKAEKARVRAQKKRAKTERKKLAKIEKKKRKARKRAQRRLDHIFSVYNGTAISQDEFETDVNISGK